MSIEHRPQINKLEYRLINYETAEGKKEEGYLLSHPGWKEIHVHVHDMKHETGCNKTTDA